MKVLLIKTSSLGDIVHTLPALTDAMQALPDVRFDWVIEERFATIASWHPAVQRVIPVALRRWRKNIFSPTHWRQWRAFRKQIKAEKYDLIIDAQGLIKSAWLSRLAKGERCGYDRQSIREPLASWFYQRRLKVSWQQHAINRIRQLFCQALYYPYKDELPRYGVTSEQFKVPVGAPYIIFFHGTTWENKHWPEAYWLELAKSVLAAGYRVRLAWGTESELAASKRMQAACTELEILPDLDITGLGPQLAHATAIVAVDTGLGHLACAFDKPTIALFGPTDANRNGVFGEVQLNIAADFPCSPCLKRQCTYGGDINIWPACFSTVPPVLVWEKLQALLKKVGALE